MKIKGERERIRHRYNIYIYKAVYLKKRVNFLICSQQRITLTVVFNKGYENWCQKKHIGWTKIRIGWTVQLL